MPEKYALWSVETAIEAFLTPPRIPELSREAGLAARAERGRVRVRAPKAGLGRGDGLEVETYAWGAGPIVLCVHGWGGKGTQFAAFVPPLVEAGFRVVAFDGPGHGRSEGTLTTGFAIAASTRTIADNVGPLAGVIAHSIGAISTGAAMHWGMEVERVALLGALCAVEPTIAEFARNRDMPADVEQGLRDWFLSEFQGEPISVDLVAPGFTAPALLLHDPDDPDVSYLEAERIAAAWPGAELVSVFGVGHVRILRARAVVERVLAFLATGMTTR